STCLHSYTDTPPPQIYPLSLHDALPICRRCSRCGPRLTRRSSCGRRSCASKTRHHGRWRWTSRSSMSWLWCCRKENDGWRSLTRSEEHTSELQSLRHLVCRLLLEKKKTT